MTKKKGHWWNYNNYKTKDKDIGEKKGDDDDVTFLYEKRKNNIDEDDDIKVLYHRRYKTSHLCFISEKPRAIKRKSEHIPIHSQKKLCNV